MSGTLLAAGREGTGTVMSVSSPNVWRTERLMSGAGSEWAACSE